MGQGSDGEFLLVDGAVVSLVALAWLLLALRVALRQERAFVGWAVLGITVFGGVVRLLIAQPLPLDPWGRAAPLARAIVDGPVLGMLAGVTHSTWYRIDVIFAVGFGLAVITPPLVFLAGRELLQRTDAALWAAAATAVLPQHIIFSRSDVESLQSIAWAMLAMGAVLALLRDGPRPFRAITAILLPWIATIASSVRPVDIVVTPLLMVLTCVVRPGTVPRSRRAIVLGLLSVALVVSGAGWALENGSSLRDSHTDLGWIAVRALSGVFEPQLNVLLSGATTPIGMPLLAAAGFVVLIQQRFRRVAFFLLGWLAVMFFLHAGVHPSQFINQARHHLHLIVPVVLLAGAGSAAVARWNRRAGAALAAYLAIVPLLHLPFERDVQYAETREYMFLRDLRDQIPANCTVLEFRGRRDSLFHPIGATIGAQRWRIVYLDQTPPKTEDSTVLRDFELNPEAQATFDSPPACLYLHQGRACRTAVPQRLQTATACREALSAFSLELVASTLIPARFINENTGGDAAGDGTSLPVRLYRASRRHQQ